MFDALELANEMTRDPAAEIADAIHDFEISMQICTRKKSGGCLAVGQNFYVMAMNFELADAA
jgi:hypothetical protein